MPLGSARLWRADTSIELTTLELASFEKPPVCITR